MKKIISTITAALLTVTAIAAPCMAAPNATLEATILAGVRAGKAEIDITACDATIDEAMDAFKHIYLVEPDMYPVSNHVSCKYKNDKATAVTIQYAVDQAGRAKYEQALAAAVAEVSKETTEYGKAKAAHDYLIKNVKAGASGFSSYSALVEGSGVCSGFSLAYKAIMNKVGVSCEIAVSPVMNHEWNVVKIDGNWYHADILWDKNTSDANGGQPCYDNFAKSDMMISFLGHTGWVVSSGIVAVDSKYDVAAA